MSVRWNLRCGYILTSLLFFDGVTNRYPIHNFHRSSVLSVLLSVRLIFSFLLSFYSVIFIIFLIQLVQKYPTNRLSPFFAKTAPIVQVSYNFIAYPSSSQLRLFTPLSSTLLEEQCNLFVAANFHN